MNNERSDYNTLEDSLDHIASYKDNPASDINVALTNVLCLKDLNIKLDWIWNDRSTEVDEIIGDWYSSDWIDKKKVSDFMDKYCDVLVIKSDWEDIDKYKVNELVFNLLQRFTRTEKPYTEIMLLKIKDNIIKEMKDWLFNEFKKRIEKDCELLKSAYWDVSIKTPNDQDIKNYIDKNVNNYDYIKFYSYSSADAQFSSVKIFLDEIKKDYPVKVLVA